MWDSRDAGKPKVDDGCFETPSSLGELGAQAISQSNVGMFRLWGFDEVSSTNDIVKQAIAGGEHEGFAVSAHSQTGGYGRRGNKWASGPGGVYVSVLLEPDRAVHETATLSLVAAIAVRRALVAFLPKDDCDIVKIKWPNDVVVMDGDFGKHPNRDRAFRKICGISLEQKGRAVCMGIGINVKPPATDAPSSPLSAQGRNIPVYLHDLLNKAGCLALPTIDDVGGELLHQLSLAYEEWRAAGFLAFRDEFMDYFALEGFRVRIDQAEGAQAIRCEALDVNAEGHLIVLPEGSDETTEIAAGTVTIVA